MQFRGLFILIFFSLCPFIQAQHWFYCNPAIMYDVNTIEIPAPGVIAIGGGREANDSTEIMFQSRDYGLTWYENAHDGLNPWIKSMAFSDSTHGFAVGYEGRIIRSDDAGGNWGQDTVPINRNLNKIVYTGAGIYFVAGGKKANDSIQTILESVDYGHIWYVIYDNLGPWLKSVFFSDAQKGFAVGDDGAIISTTDGGSTWMSPIPPVVRDFNGITFINANTGYIVGGTTSGSGKRTILRTTDGGLSWIVIMDENGGVLRDISFADSLVGYIVGDSATVLKTMDGGLSWATIVIDTTLTGNESFNAVKFYDRNFGAIGGKTGKLYIYTDFKIEAYTLGLEQIGLFDATLKGAINTHTKKARYSFIYSKNIMLSQSSTQEVNLLNDSLLFFSEHIQGLESNTTYFYFLKAITATDSAYGDTLSFYTGINPPFSFQTQDATCVGAFSAQLNGTINKFSSPVNLFFEYGTSPAFGSQIGATPAFVNDTILHSLHASIDWLQLNKQYFYRLKGEIGSQTIYGDTKMFFAVNLPWVITKNATDITSTSAQVNGSVDNNGIPTAIKFEFGLTSLYGNEVNATPDSVYGTNHVDVSFLLSGLPLTTTCHFRIKAINLNGISYGDDMTFVAGGPSAVVTNASNIKINDAQLNGFINANNSPSGNKFEYGLTKSYGNEVIATPDSATGSNNVSISCHLSGLFSDTIYHFRVKATNARGTNYSEDMTFFTASPPVVVTLPASDISSNTARLNGSLNADGLYTFIKFDYGIDTAYGNQIIASPDTTSSIGNIDVHVFLEGLLPGTFYHYRLKGTNSDTTNFGNDMMFFSGPPEIPNYDFEIWDTSSVEFPEGWTQGIGIVSKYSPGSNGSYAVKVQNSPEGRLGAISMGKLGNGLNGTGVPFNARPDTLIGSFKYNIDVTDTSLIALILKKNGIVASKNIFVITGNSGGNFITLKFPITYQTSDIPDSLIIALASSSLIHSMELHSPNSWIIADNLHFTGTSLNITNNDFEQWQLKNNNNLINWNYEGKGLIPPDTITPAVIRTTDAMSKSFAAKVKATFNENKKTPGRLISGNNTTDKFPVLTRHQSLTGYYKFLPVNNDTMCIIILMYKNNALIGSGHFFQNITTSTYTPFIVNIYYVSQTEIPDSASITFQTYTSPPFGNSVLYIDNLNFDGFLSGIKDPPLTAAGNFDFNIYPNPFNEQASIAFTINRDEKVLIRLFDLSGKQVAMLADGKFTAGSHSINLSAQGLQKGFYVCVVNTEKASFSKKLVIY